MFTDSPGTVHVRWDRGFQLGLTPGHDRDLRATLAHCGRSSSAVPAMARAVAASCSSRPM
jgi:hypothetical protein